MEKPDLAINEYASSQLTLSCQTVLYVGWLERGQKFPTGQTSAEFKARLKIFCSEIDAMTLGIHPCYFCNEFAEDFDRTVVEGLELGSRETFVCGSNDILYYIPDLIYHYVRDHNYLPPAEFIEAVLTSPLPSSPIYKLRTEYDSAKTNPVYRGILQIDEAAPFVSAPHVPGFYKATLFYAKNAIIPLEIWPTHLDKLGGLSAVNNQLVEVTGILILYDENEPPVLGVDWLNLVET